MFKILKKYPLEKWQNDESSTLMEIVLHYFWKILLSRFTQILVCCSTIIGIPILIWGYLESFKIQLREIKINFTELPEKFHGYRIAYISDLHIQFDGIREKKLQKLLSKLEADILVLGGDYQYQDYSNDEKIFEIVKRLITCNNFADGVIAIRGNHDLYSLHERLKEQEFMNYLLNQTQTVNRDDQKIQFCGLHYFGRRPQWILDAADELENTRDKNEFSIFLSHAPDAFLEASDRNYNFAIAGDTHGGQIRLPGIGAIIKKTKLPKAFAYGLNQIDKMKCYTSSGVGLIGLPCRIFCRPEIVVFTLQKFKN